ncbi:uncharacterized protein [Halyomorpha halys]|uniref:uncharacterized protein n=1 Tax=Halyomorpha halys TaxID=286706 RepID=UPI0006D4E013|nr:uncharacterized protein LOC106686192 [Halyomorpha halys]
MADDNSSTKRSFLDDCQLKELIQTENLSKQRWQRKWSSLNIQQIYREEAVKLGLDPDFLFKRRKKKSDDKELEVKIAPSPPPPKTMSQFVGWRSRAEHSLEICGPLYVSPKQELAKEEVKSYNTIFLG